MRTSEPVRVGTDGAILTITLDAPERRNALTPQMLCLLADAIQRFGVDTSLRVAVITGSGDRAFCAGGDLARTIPLMTGARPPEDEWDRRVLDDPVVLAASGLRDYPLHKPVVAAINGACLAAGFELMLGTDVRIAADHATFGLPEAQRGVIPFAGSIARLPRQVPYAWAMQLLLTGQSVDANEALRMGLVSQVVAAEDLPAAAYDVAERIARNGPVAVQAIKRAALAASGVPLAQAYAIENEAKRQVMASDDAREGPRAFIEKREPRFTGK